MQNGGQGEDGRSSKLTNIGQANMSRDSTMDQREQEGEGGTFTLRTEGSREGGSL
mgnify:CR=1 FL=1